MLEHQVLQVVDNEQPAQVTESSAPDKPAVMSKRKTIRKVITKEPKQPMPLYAPSSSTKCEDSIGVLAGYTKRYYRNQTTGRPNQVFVCSTCGAQPRKSVCRGHHAAALQTDEVVRLIESRTPRHRQPGCRCSGAR